MRGAHRNAYARIQRYARRPGFTYLYVLTDDDASPSPRNIRYVGKTSQKPISRLYHHLQDRHQGQTHRDRWIRKLVAAGGESKMHVVALVPNEYAGRAEAKLIISARAAGARLVNLTDGGEGKPGHVVSEETRRKISLKQRGVKERLPVRADVRERFLERLRERWSQPENRRHQSEKMKARLRMAPFTDERRRRISEALKGKALSAAAKDKLRLANLGKRHTLQAGRRKFQTYWRQLRLSREQAEQLILSPGYF